MIPFFRKRVKVKEICSLEEFIERSKSFNTISICITPCLIIKGSETSGDIVKHKYVTKIETSEDLSYHEIFWEISFHNHPSSATKNNEVVSTEHLLFCELLANKCRERLPGSSVTNLTTHEIMDKEPKEALPYGVTLL